MHFNTCKNITPLTAGSQLSTRIFIISVATKKGEQDTKLEYQHFSYLPVTHLPLLVAFPSKNNYFFHCDRATTLHGSRDFEDELMMIHLKSSHLNHFQLSRVLQDQSFSFEKKEAGAAAKV